MNREQAPKTKKVSEIFLRYVAPLIEDAPDDITPEKLQAVFRFPITVWNAMAMKKWGKPTDYIQEIVNCLAGAGSPEMVKMGEAMVRMWVRRKEEMYPDEHWAISDVVVYRDFNGELTTRVVARATGVRAPTAEGDAGAGPPIRAQLMLRMVRL